LEKIPKAKMTRPASQRLTTDWQRQLLVYIMDPENHASVVYHDNEFVIVKDLYPKAKHHFLLMPREELELENLNVQHIPMIKKMNQLASSFTEQFQTKFQFGFHAVPSLKQLHLHLISKDLKSDWLKIKKHYLSFTTKFFLDPVEVIEKLSTSNFHIDKERYLELLQGQLLCHLCGQDNANMPKLKAHLETH
jgi:aprataxin